MRVSGALAGAPPGLGGLVVLALGLAAGPAHATEPIRVALWDGIKAVEVGVAEPMPVLEAGTRRELISLRGAQIVRVVPGPAGLVVASQPLGSSGVRLEGRRGVLRVGARDFVGALEIWRSGEGLVVVNELPLEDYVAGTVRAEAPEKWPTEALRALAVAARTYAVFQQARNAARVYHLVAASQDQNFAGHVPEGAPAWAVARATAGQVLTWQGKVFPAFYHSDSGGFTEPPHTVFSGDGLAPLAGVRDEYSIDSPHYSWTTTLTLAAIGERLRQSGLDVGAVTRLTVLERSPSLRAARILVEHARGSIALKGTEFRRIVGYDALKSTLFVATAHDGLVRFEGRGYGHGVGLSQFGAKGMAERGHAYPQILEHYYPGTSVMTLR